MTREEFDKLSIGDEVIWTNGYSVCTYKVCGKETSQGNILYEADGDTFYMPYENVKTKAMYDEQKAMQYKNSITLGRLKQKIDEALAENPSWNEKMVYMDCLALYGIIEENGSFLELS